jgi:hypothetical protein
LRKLLLLAAAVASAGLVVVAAAAAVTDRGIEPVAVEGNPDCKDVAGLNYTNQVRFKTPINGSSAGGITVLLISPTTNIQWFVNNADPLVNAVIVKGGIVRTSIAIREATSRMDT